MKSSAPFSGSQASNYVEGPPRTVPGFDGLHRMVSQLLAETTPPNGRIFVLGAGGGLELRTLASDQPFWTFEGIDPSRDMLDTARTTAAPFMDRIALVEGTVEAASAGPFDAATCLLTFHFIARENRLPTLREIHRRLKLGAPFILAHISFPQSEPERSLWLGRHIAFGGGDPDNVAAREAMTTHLTILDQEEEETMLKAAGFKDVALFYAGLSFKGWLAYA